MRQHTSLQVPLTYNSYKSPYQPLPLTLLQCTNSSHLHFYKPLPLQTYKLLPPISLQAPPTYIPISPSHLLPYKCLSPTFLQAPPTYISNASEDLLIDGILQLHATIERVSLIVLNQLRQTVELGGAYHIVTILNHDSAVTNFALSSEEEYQDSMIQHTHNYYDHGSRENRLEAKRKAH